MRSLVRNKRPFYLCQKQEDGFFGKPIKQKLNYQPVHSIAERMVMGEDYKKHMKIKCTLEEGKIYSNGDRLYIYSSPPEQTNYFTKMTLVSGYRNSLPFIPPNTAVGANLQHSIPKFITLKAGKYRLDMEDMVVAASANNHKIVYYIWNANTGAIIRGNLQMQGGNMVIIEDNYWDFELLTETDIYIHFGNYINPTTVTQWALPSKDTEILGLRIVRPDEEFDPLAEDADYVVYGEPMDTLNQGHIDIRKLSAADENN